ncbi:MULTISPECIES: DUF4239 domain-containing protein [unclassified Rhizobium]|jgi:hypothetical protein|uniref:bestrophin-like domain n=1 Tax=unclassified Rhizobium TaxID=2613769 RepID=UPI0006455E5F|nr:MULTISPECIES: DUF4239 domain-containing protein [unclassified Rhizobium]MBN8953383.1 DUF4239 domain-containing protein [Rhizobium tropici]OJY74399.1 MAG: hypothetical protein BGP09_18150 [Rhizobium sp. 60-20]RKD68014.1 uncharacterized protein DUF4239 [Rhizobium sp. WW_1]
MQREMVWTLALFVLLVFSAAAGSVLRAKLPAPHRSGETMDFLRVVTALLVTFAALVMSLILASELNAFTTASHDRNRYAAGLAEMDRCLRNYGAALDDERQLLRSYTTAVIASTWPGEPLPPGVTHPDVSKLPLTGEAASLGSILNAMGLGIAHEQPSDPAHQLLVARCNQLFGNLLTARWTVIEDAHGSLSAPFLGVLIFWLMLVFLSFGLQAPRNALTGSIVVVAIVSVASVLFVILDLDLPYGGLFSISSESMRHALADMLAQ